MKNPPLPTVSGSSSARELTAVFLKLGVTSVGGPAAHIAMMNHEVVERRRWLTSQEFLDLVGATNLIPGPNSTEMAIHIGYARAGWRGLVVAGACFILPAVLIVGSLAAVYVRFGALPETRALFYGIKPVVVAAVALALWGLGRTALRSAWHVVLGVAALAAVVAGLHELLLLAACGVVGALSSTRSGEKSIIHGVFPILAAGPTVATLVAYSCERLFLVFLKAGAFLFGSGYVLLAFLHADLVERLHWLTRQELLDAIAVGQITPGPVFTTATFIGYVLGGPVGGLVATVGIFLPAFAYVAASAPILPRLRRSAALRRVLDGVNVGSLALMAVVTWELGRAAVVDWATLALLVGSGLLMFATRCNPAWLIAGGALIGVALRY